MWELNEPKPVKLIVGILAADSKCLEAARDRLVSEFGEADFVSEVWAPRPVNLDPGVMEPSKLILASTKNFSHRIYIGKKMYAEVTLLFDKGQWRTFDYTFPDYKQEHYFEFFSKVRKRLVEQFKSHL